MTSLLTKHHNRLLYNETQESSQFLQLQLTNNLFVLLSLQKMNSEGQQKNTLLHFPLKIQKISEITILQSYYMISKIETRERNEFRVKFTQTEHRKNNLNNKEMIIGGRSRTVRDLNTMSNRVNIKFGQSSDESSIDSEASKRELKMDSLISPKAIEYTQNNTSVILSGFQALSQFFEEEVAFKLIFRASHHKFSVKHFHTICDSYEDTITVCLTEDSKIIGGFTPLSWQDQFEKNSTHFKTDFKRETFLFSVTDNAKYPLVKSLKNKAICCFKAYGPTFGGGYDLLIGDRSNEIANTTSYFPRNFEHPNPSNFNKRDFTGTSRKHFKLQEWEVFQVTRLRSFKTVQTVNFNQTSVLTQLRGEKSLFQKFKIAAKDFFTNLFND